MSNNGGCGASPSKARRDRLSEELSVPLVSNFFALTKYYEAADKVYKSFLILVTEESFGAAGDVADDDNYQSLDDAYVYGKRYCLFVMDAIPGHNYYGTRKFRETQRKHERQMNIVLTQLEKVVGMMDKQELLLLELHRREEQKRREEMERRELAAYEQLQRRAKMALTNNNNKSSGSGSSDDGSPEKKKSDNVEMSALSKLELLRPPQQPQVVEEKKREEEEDERRQGFPPPPDPSGTGSSRYRFVESSEDEEDNEDEQQRQRQQQQMQQHHQQQPLPPPLLPPSAQQQVQAPTAPPPVPAATAVPPPGRAAAPSMSEWLASAAVSNSALASTPSIGGPPPPPSYDQAVSKERKKARYRSFLGPSEPSQQQHQENALFPPQQQQHQQQPAAAMRHKAPKKQQQRVPMRTLQARCQQAYRQYEQAGQIKVHGLRTYQGRRNESTNGCTVISALNAARHVVRSLTDEDIVQVIDHQCGPLLKRIRRKLGLEGHALIIPSDVHDFLVDEKILRQDSFVGAAGGNILDPDHLSEFLKLLTEPVPIGSNGHKQHRRASATLFFREHVISIVKRPSSATGGCQFDLIDSLPGRGGVATRTRCATPEALHALLLHYASNKFTPSNCTYIDKNTWDDSMADFDPRVFQGFVWADTTSKGN